MDYRTKLRIAMAEAIMQAMWAKGLITVEQRDEINQKNRESFMNEANC